MQQLRIITRNSQLAIWQADFVKSKLQGYYPNLKVEIIGVTTTGDKILDKSLDKIGGKGLFIKELELGLLSNKADIAVHSLKDLPANLPSEFKIAAILEREEAHDALVSTHYTSLKDMPKEAIIGTSSARRLAIIKRYYPHLQVKLLRGNLITRLNKLDNEQYDGIILAVAGLKRLNLEHRITQRLSLTEFIPAIGQGALAIEILSSRPELIEFLSPLKHKDTTLAVNAERFVGEALGANCSVPIAVHATIDNFIINVDAMLADHDNRHYYFANACAPKEDYLEAAKECVASLIAQGASKVIAKY